MLPLVAAVRQCRPVSRSAGAWHGWSRSNRQTGVGGVLAVVVFDEFPCVLAEQEGVTIQLAAIQQFRCQLVKAACPSGWPRWLRKRGVQPGDIGKCRRHRARGEPWRLDRVHAMAFQMHDVVWQWIPGVCVVLRAATPGNYEAVFGEGADDLVDQLDTPPETKGNVPPAAGRDRLRAVVPCSHVG